MVLEATLKQLFGLFLLPRPQVAASSSSASMQAGHQEQLMQEVAARAALEAQLARANEELEASSSAARSADMQVSLGSGALVLCWQISNLCCECNSAGCGTCSCKMSTRLVSMVRETSTIRLVEPIVHDHS
jgi:hypothetical protein